VFVCGRLAGKQHPMICISQGSARHYSSEVGEFTIFWCEISSGLYTPKIVEIVFVSVELLKI